MASWQQFVVDLFGDFALLVVVLAVVAGMFSTEIERVVKAFKRGRK